MTETIRDELIDYMTSCRRTLHQIPELHADLPQTRAFVCSQLEQFQIPYVVYEKGGIVATVGGKRPGRNFLLREDMDALPLEEKSGEPFSSTNGRMHACGHDLHTAMLLCAARMLKEQEGQIPGTVDLLFQFDEEGLTGMRTLVETYGLLEKKTYGGALALHVFPGQGMHAGSYSCLPGPANASVSEYRILLEGRGAHGSTPYKGIDAVYAGVQIYNALMSLLPKEIDPQETVSWSNGYFLGGSSAAYNIVPESCLMGGGVRTMSNETAAYLRERIRTIALSTAETLRTKCTVTFPATAPSCVNDAEICDYVNRSAASLGMKNLEEAPHLSSDDFAHVCVRVPSCYVWIGAGGPEDIYKGGVLHDPSVHFNEAVMPYGVRLLVSTALTWLEEHPL